METPYWQRMEVQPNFKEWLSFFNGCIHCDCGHGCSQWIKEQQYRTWLIMKIQSDSNATTKLDKLVQIPLDRINKIWYRLASWNADKFNRELRQEHELNIRAKKKEEPYNPIFQKYNSVNKWYFWDEATENDYIGPFDTEELAKMEYERYCREVLGHT